MKDRVKSIRLPSELAERLSEAARGLGVSESAFIRDAIETYAKETLSRRLDPRLTKMIGAIDSEILVADRASEAFDEYLAADHVKQSNVERPEAIPARSAPHNLVGRDRSNVPAWPSSRLDRSGLSLEANSRGRY